MHFAQELAGWYNLHKRDLPWRDTRDPYKIWISEIILQQTRVNQGLSYYHRFVEAFPDVFSLASADLAAVLKLWQGLGYYSRARNMHLAARYIAGQGNFPATYKEILLLKGIGPYTAAAIASFSFNEAVPVIDGNVYRVLSRFFGLDEPVDTSKGKKIFTELAEKVMDKNYPALHNQAIMEFGAMLCKPVSPLCGECPLVLNCTAHRLGTPEAFPVKSKTTKVRDRFFSYLVIRTDKGIYTRKRIKKDIWQGLHDFPLIESADKTDTSEVIVHEALERFKPFRFLADSKPFYHQLSHQSLHAVFHEFRIEHSPSIAGLELTPYNRLHELPVPRLIEKYMNESGLL